MCTANYRERQVRNDLSRRKAVRAREPWTTAEDTFLREKWCTDVPTRIAIAEQLGRTVEACRERYSRVFGSHRSANKTEHVGETCPECYLVHAGECF